LNHELSAVFCIACSVQLEACGCIGIRFRFAACSRIFIYSEAVDRKLFRSLLIKELYTTISCFYSEGFIIENEPIKYTKKDPHIQYP
jgi:hypothetical protein